MNAPRPGSRKASVYDKFNSQGQEAAEELGASLGLAESSVRAWLRTWAGGTVKLEKPKPSPSVKPAAKAKVAAKDPPSAIMEYWLLLNLMHSPSSQLIQGVHERVAKLEATIGVQVNAKVAAELDALMKEMRARFAAIMKSHNIS